MKKHLILSLLTCAFLSFSPLSMAQTKISNFELVVSEGTGAIVDSTDVAERAALYSALRNSVEQITGVYISSETKTSNFQVLSDEVYTNATGFVSSYEILDKKVKNNIVHIKVRAKVSLEPLTESLKKLGLLRKWTVVTIAAPSNLTQASEKEFSDSVSTAINHQIISNGFKVVDRDIIAGLESPELLKQIMAGNYLSALPLLKFNGVDFLIIAKSFTEDVFNDTLNVYGVNVNLRTSKGRIETKLIKADTGEVLSTKSFEDTSVGSGGDLKSDALKKASDLAGKYFVNEIAKIPAATSSNIELTIKGIPFEKVKAVYEAFRTTRNVKRVTNKGYQGKTAIFEIQTEGDVFLLTDNITENAALKKLIKLEINSVSSGKVEMLAK